MKRKIKKITSIVVLICVCASVFIGCGKTADKFTNAKINNTANSVFGTENLLENAEKASNVLKLFDLNSVPEFCGKPYVPINNNIPYFTNKEIESGFKSFINLSELDLLGRCGTAYASVSTDTMPTEERGNIGGVKPSGWHTVKYDGIDGNYLYNRCHLLMFALTGLNAEERNLITGTRYLNIEGNLPFEKKIVEYIEQTGNHVLYRVTPIFEDNNLLCSGELLEAYSVEDNGVLQFCVYCYNVQPGIEIDYATGESKGSEFTGNTETTTSGEITTSVMNSAEKADYVLNISSKKFHKPDCESVNTMSDKNKQKVNKSRQEIINEGYLPCKSCNP